MKRLLGLITTLFGLAALAPAQDFNLDVLNNYGIPANTYGAAAAQTGFWQNVDAWDGLAPQPIADTSGAVTTATVDFTLGGNFSFDNAATFGDDQALMDDVQDIGGVGNVSTWTIAGLAAGDYAVYSYAWAPDSPVNFITGVTLSGGANGQQNCGGAAWGGGHVLGQTYVVDSIYGVTAGGSITLTFTAVAGFGSVNGVQLDKLPGPTINNCQILPTVTQTCQSVASFAGTPSATAGSGFTLTFGGMNANVNGVVFYGVNGSTNQTWSAQSNLCVKTPTVRLGGVTGASGNTGGTVGLCNGQYSFDMNTQLLAAGITQGTPVNVQGWQRDPASGKTTNLTDAIGFVVGP